MKSKKNKRAISTREYIYTRVSIFLLIDQIIKLYVRKYLGLNKEIVVIPDFFSILHLENKGAAFSILENKVGLLIVISAGMLVILDKYLLNEVKGDRKLEFLLSMIIGGLCGNLIDRILYRSVTDYLSFTFFGYSFAVFNFADILITVGIFLMIISLICDEIKEKSKNKLKILE